MVYGVKMDSYRAYFERLNHFLSILSADFNGCRKKGMYEKKQTYDNGNVS